MGNRLLVASLRDVAPVPPPAPDGVTLVPAAEAGIAAIGRAYWESYGGEAADSTLDEAVEDVRRAFHGAYGRFRADASLAALAGGAVVGAVLTVQDAPWDDVPPGPYVIDLFVVVPHRRAGIGRALMVTAMAAAAAAAAAGGTTMGLRVEDDAVAATALYTALGFRPL